MNSDRKSEHIPLSEDVQNGDSLQGGANIVKNRDDAGFRKRNENKLVSIAPTQIKKYTVIDLLKSKRLFLTSLIMWFAW